MYKVKIKCSFCGELYFREIGRANEAKKFSWKQFCSQECLIKSRMIGKILTCTNPDCNKTFYRPLREIKKVNRSFCCQSCAAKFYNKNRGANRSPKLCANPLCRRPLPLNTKRKYCSISHRINPQAIPIEKYKEILISRIKSFCALRGRIPLKREMQGMYRTARKLFGTWNGAIEAAGLDPNPVIFSKKFIAKDGHKCNSFAEKIIDDWFHEKKIEHQKEVSYPENKLLSTDFVVKNNFIEYFGLSGIIPQYDKLMREKRKICKKYKLSLIEIYPKDLFPVNHLSEIIKIKKI